MSASDLRRSIDDLLAPRRRILLGVVGPPASGKSALAAWIVRDTNARLATDVAALLPMDGFHLANDELVFLGRRERKGAPDTFDVAGFIAALDRARAGTDTVYVPEFHREMEESIANAIAIRSDVQLVVVEGNYLLHDRDGWDGVRSRLDAVWYLDVPWSLREARLLERHRSGHGDGAAAWVATVDAPNAVLIETTRHRADQFVGAPDLAGFV